MNRMFRASSLSLTIIQLSTTILGIIGIVIYQFTYTEALMVLLGYFLLSGIGISIFYHRYLSHRCFKTNIVYEYMGTILGILAGRGSPIGWVTIQRMHHRYADTVDDPHMPIINDVPTWRILIPKLITQADEYNINPFIVRDLLKNKFHLFVNNYYNLILFLFVCMFSFISFHSFIFLWVIPVALTAWILNLSVYIAHKHGYRTYSIKDGATNSWFISLLLWGEGWHNNHHHDTSKWNLREKWWEIDPAAGIIRLLKNG